ncbi:MAG: glycoside hydrolase family 140 protein [Bacteroidota bacterium]
MKRLVILLFFCSAELALIGQSLKVSDNQRFLVTEDGKPFFWLGDTAWELFHRCDREEADHYLETRASQGFTVIHAVALAELDGLHDPNPYGETPLIDDDPSNPNPKYFEHVDYIIAKADELGMYVALLPTWGDKLFKAGWGIGPEVLNADNAEALGKWMGERYKERDNIIWVMGGDRNPREGSDDIAVWNAMAKGVTEGVGSAEEALITFHPQPSRPGGSSNWFHQEEWLDFNMHQTGHCPNQPTYEIMAHDYNLSPTKPVLDGEPLYEDHPNCFNAKELGHSVPSDIRRIIYWNVFAGSFGHSYGCHAVWQMFTNDKDPINYPLRPWKEALQLPLANQMKHLKNLMLSRPFLSRIPDQSMVISKQEDDETYVIATRDSEGSYAMIYFPTGKTIELDLTNLNGDMVSGWWYDTRTGVSFQAASYPTDKMVDIMPPSQGKGNDWVLVLDAQENHFGRPGDPLLE